MRIARKGENISHFLWQSSIRGNGGMYTKGASSMPTFDPTILSEEGARALQTAEREARKLGNAYIGAEHILLGLAYEAESVASTALLSFNVDPRTILMAIEFILGKEDKEVASDVPIDLTERSLVIVRLALAASRSPRFLAPRIQTAHLLIGILAEGESTAMGILESLRVTRGTLQPEIQRLFTLSVSPQS